MHDPKHSNQVNGALIITATFIVGVMLWYIIASSGDNYTATPIDTDTGAVIGGERLYQNDIYGFSLRYDDKFDVIESDQDRLWKFNSSEPGKHIVTFRLPTETYPKSNFREALLSIGASTDPQAVANCLVASNEETESAREGPFSVYTQSSAAAGSFFDVKSHRMVHGEYCISIDEIIHSVNLNLYDDQQNFREFDRGEVRELLDRAIASIKFN